MSGKKYIVTPTLPIFLFFKDLFISRKKKLIEEIAIKIIDA